MRSATSYHFAKTSEAGIIVNVDDLAQEYFMWANVFPRATIWGALRRQVSEKHHAFNEIVHDCILVYFAVKK